MQVEVDLIQPSVSAFGSPMGALGRPGFYVIIRSNSLGCARGSRFKAFETDGQRQFIEEESVIAANN